MKILGKTAKRLIKHIDEHIIVEKEVPVYDQSGNLQGGTRKKVLDTNLTNIALNLFKLFKIKLESNDEDPLQDFKNRLKELKALDQIDVIDVPLDTPLLEDHSYVRRDEE